MAISPKDIEAGRFFTPEEDHRAAHVIVIGRNLSTPCSQMENVVGIVLADETALAFGVNPDHCVLRTIEDNQPPW